MFDKASAAADIASAAAVASSKSDCSCRDFMLGISLSVHDADGGGRTCSTPGPTCSTRMVPDGASCFDPGTCAKPGFISDLFCSAFSFLFSEMSLGCPVKSCSASAAARTDCGEAMPIMAAVKAARSLCLAASRPFFWPGCEAGEEGLTCAACVLEALLRAQESVLMSIALGGFGDSLFFRSVS
jgi:hypothetical protein